jgi:ribosomal protein L22
MADDPKTKTDQPSDTVPEEQAAAQAEEAKEAAAVEEAAEEKPKPKPRARKKKVEPEAEDTAAAETGVDKDAAEAEKPKRTRGSRGSRGRTKAPAEAEAEAPPKTEAKPRRAAAATNGAAPVVRAHAKYVRTSARKARMVCDHIRGKSVDEARAILAYTPRAVARDWSKLLESAVANAEHNHELVGDDLKVLAAFADEGPTLKRFRPRAMGRATRIRKRTSHLTITLTPKETQR